MKGHSEEGERERKWVRGGGDKGRDTHLEKIARVGLVGGEDKQTKFM